MFLLMVIGYGLLVIDYSFWCLVSSFWFLVSGSLFQVLLIELAGLPCGQADWL